LDLRPESQNARLKNVIALVRRNAAMVGQCAEKLAQVFVLTDFDVELQFFLSIVSQAPPCPQ
jgi:hypothetical protein